MVLFTEEMKEWFTAAVFERQDDLDKDCCKFLKCFVMSTSGVAATKSTALSGADLTSLPQGIDPDVEMTMDASMGDPNINAASSGQ